MQLAIMQPYLFPYIGYFHLLASVDKIVMYDDVNFIKQGWVNRNQILLNGQPHLFTIPLQSASSFLKINETPVNEKLPWREKLLKTIDQAYKKAPQYSVIMPLVAHTLQKSYRSIGEMATESIQVVLEYLTLPQALVPSAAIYSNQHLQGQERVLDICRQENAESYHNAIGGQALYSKDTFRHENINLEFVKSKMTPYKQFKNPFVAGLSIIDVLMFNTKNEVSCLLDDYELV